AGWVGRGTWFVFRGSGFIFRGSWLVIHNHGDSIGNKTRFTPLRCDAQILHFDVLLDAVLRSFAADAGLLHASERRDFVGDQTGVHANHAGFDRFAHAPDAAYIARVEIGGEPELAVVRHRHALLFGLEAEQRRHRTEGLLARDLHAGLDVREDGGLEEQAAQRVFLATDDHLRALCQRVADMLLDFRHGVFVDEGPDVHSGFRSRA